MALMTPLRRLLGRKPVEIDVSGTQAARLAHSANQSPNHAANQSANRNSSAAFLPSGAGSDPVEPETTQLLRRLVERIEAQSAAARQPDPAVAQLPKAIDALGDLRRQSLALMDAIGEQLESGRERDEAMRTALAKVGQSTEQSTELLRHLQEHLEAASHASGSLNETVAGLGGALGELTASNERVARTLGELSGADQERHERLVKAMASWQVWSIVAIAAAAVAALCAAGAAIAALVVFVR